jgi:hypothetical protein
MSASDRMIWWSILARYAPVYPPTPHERREHPREPPPWRPRVGAEALPSFADEENARARRTIWAGVRLRYVNPTR